MFQIFPSKGNNVLQLDAVSSRPMFAFKLPRTSLTKGLLFSEKII